MPGTPIARLAARTVLAVGLVASGAAGAMLAQPPAAPPAQAISSTQALPPAVPAIEVAGPAATHRVDPTPGAPAATPSPAPTAAAAVHHPEAAQHAVPTARPTTTHHPEPTHHAAPTATPAHHDDGGCGDGGHDGGGHHGGGHDGGDD